MYLQPRDKPVSTYRAYTHGLTDLTQNFSLIQIVADLKNLRVGPRDCSAAWLFPVELLLHIFLIACTSADEELDPNDWERRLAFCKETYGDRRPIVRRPESLHIRCTWKAMLPILNAALFGTIFLSRKDHWNYVFGRDGLAQGVSDEAPSFVENCKRTMVNQVVVVIDRTEPFLPFDISSIRDPKKLDPKMWSVSESVGLQLSAKLSGDRRIVIAVQNDLLPRHFDGDWVPSRTDCPGNQETCAALTELCRHWRRAHKFPYYPSPVWMHGVHDLHRSAVRTLLLGGKGVKQIVGPLSELSQGLFSLYRPKRTGDPPARSPPPLIVTSPVDWLAKAAYARLLDMETPWLLRISDPISRGDLIQYFHDKGILTDVHKVWKFVDESGVQTQVSWILMALSTVLVLTTHLLVRLSDPLCSSLGQGERLDIRHVSHRPISPCLS